MRKFTDTEIGLCKKIAEKGEGREIEKYDLVLATYSDGTELVGRVKNTERGIVKVEGKTSHISIYPDSYVLIWQEHDCLEWLREKGYIIRLPYQKGLMKKDIEFSEYFDGEFTKQEVFIKGYNFMEKPLEWLLSAVLAIMEKK